MVHEGGRPKPRAQEFDLGANSGTLEFACACSQVDPDTAELCSHRLVLSRTSSLLWAFVTHMTFVGHLFKLVQVVL